MGDMLGFLGVMNSRRGGHNGGWDKKDRSRSHSRSWSKHRGHQKPHHHKGGKKN